ncbi:MAG: hypothetical protein NUV51_09180 [Sulfuricaulis sp.]|nr:hypothetical protein [Sulfuricaulis sp.]
MRDALNYPVSTRPEAMKSYLEFLRETGKSPDTKTRMPIAVSGERPALYTLVVTGQQ